jgi:hypothetical protein
MSIRSIAREVRDSFRQRRKHKRFHAEFEEFKGRSDGRLATSWDDRFPCLDDRTETTEFDPHYTYHTAWAARQLTRERPAEHVDISSSLYFCTIVSAFIPIRFYDVRPAKLVLSGLKSSAANLMALPFPDASIKSLSCMHTIEHIGLGRYDAVIDPDGDLKAARELCRVLALGGLLLMVVPMSKPRVRFNGDRLYDYDSLVGLFPNLAVEEFALIPDDISKGMVIDGARELSKSQKYGCGCFAFRKS